MQSNDATCRTSSTTAKLISSPRSGAQIQSLCTDQVLPSRQHRQRHTALHATPCICASSPSPWLPPCGMHIKITSGLRCLWPRGRRVSKKHDHLQLTFFLQNDPDRLVQYSTADISHEKGSRMLLPVIMYQRVLHFLSFSHNHIKSASSTVIGSTALQYHLKLP